MRDWLLLILLGLVLGALLAWGGQTATGQRQLLGQ